MLFDLLYSICFIRYIYISHYVDYHKLNSVSTFVAYPMPRVDALLALLARHGLFFFPTLEPRANGRFPYPQSPRRNRPSPLRAACSSLKDLRSGCSGPSHVPASHKPGAAAIRCRVAEMGGAHCQPQEVCNWMEGVMLPLGGADRCIHSGIKWMQWQPVHGLRQINR